MADNALLSQHHLLLLNDVRGSTLHKEPEKIPSSG